MKRGFSEQEIAEMRAFDEMIDCLDVVESDWVSRWIDDLAKLDQMDHLQRKALDRNRKYRESNKERIAEYHREYRAANKERIAEYQRAYRAANKERIAEQKREYYAERKRRKQDENYRRT